MRRQSQFPTPACLDSVSRNLADIIIRWFLILSYNNTFESAWYLADHELDEVLFKDLLRSSIYVLSSRHCCCLEFAWYSIVHDVCHKGGCRRRHSGNILEGMKSKPTSLEFGISRLQSKDHFESLNFCLSSASGLLMGLTTHQMTRVLTCEKEISNYLSSSKRHTETNSNIIRTSRLCFIYYRSS